MGITPGALWRSGDHARTVRVIAVTNGPAASQAELADRKDAHGQGEVLRAADPAAHASSWLTPIHVDVDGRVYEIPPASQGAH